MAHDTHLFGIDPGNVHDEYDRRGAGAWTDQQLVTAVAAVIARPKVAPADSFVLHAPLEVLARAALLPDVAPAARDGARRRLAWLAATYEAAGDPLPPPRPVDPRDVVDAATTLAGALRGGALDDVDAYAAWLGAHASAAELRHLLVGPIAPSLAAAGHASIFFSLYPRVAPRGEVTGTLLRGLAREVARYPEWQLHWFAATAGDDHNGNGGAPLLDALLDTPFVGLPGSSFIFPLMSQVQDNGLAAKLVGPVLTAPVDITDAKRVVSRVAAWSMLQEPDVHTPYGWTHCLTMPQAVLAVAGDGIEPRDALAIAATYVVGFRAALSDRTLVPNLPAATTDEPVGQRRQRLATAASLHHDAHFVKYTLAAFDATHDDPDAGTLYLDAADRLAAWWAALPDDEFLA